MINLFEGIGSNAGFCGGFPPRLGVSRASVRFMPVGGTGIRPFRHEPQKLWRCKLWLKRLSALSSCRYLPEKQRRRRLLVRLSVSMACGIESGSGVPNKTKVAKITKEQVRKIAEQKMPDLNAANVESAMSMIAGTARSMGVEVVD